MAIKTKGTIRIRNLPDIVDDEVVAGNFVATALDSTENDPLTRKATFEQVVSGGAVNADFVGDLYLKGVKVATMKDVGSFITKPTNEGFLDMSPEEQETEEMFIDTVMIGDKDANFVTPITFRVGDERVMRIGSEGVAIGEDTLFYTDGALAQLSDSNLKSDILKINNSENILENLNGVRFIWNKNAPKSKQGQTDVGLIAQEVEKVIPSAVRKNEKGYLAVDYSKLIPVLLESVKDQQEKIKSLEEKIESLEEKWSHLSGSN